MPLRTLDEFLKNSKQEPKTIKTTKATFSSSTVKITGFYKETDFKQTPIGKIPKEWQVVKLKQVATVSGNNSLVDRIKRFRQVARVPMEYVPENGLFVKYLMIDANKVKSYVVAKAGDILLAKITPCFENGKQGIVPLNVPNGVVLATTEVFPITPELEKINRLFLFYILKWEKYRKLLVFKMTGTTGRRRVPRQALENLLFPLPPLEEQWGVAEVLSTVDRAIEKTEELIGRLKRLQKALMQELLTKGIGHKEYKQTPIGKIPKEWKIAFLSQIATIIMGQSPPSKTYNKERLGLPFLQGKAEFGRIYPAPKLYTTKPIKIAEKGDLLISVRAPVGDVNLSPTKLCIGRGLAALRFNSNLANTMFYFYYFQHIKPYLEKLGSGSTFKAITKKELDRLRVPVPPMTEQQLIATILFSIDNWIETEFKCKRKLERLKRGLMSLLLTGKVRVKVEVVNAGNVQGSNGNAG